MPRIKSGLTPTEFAILGLLAAQPMHGYQIARHFTGAGDLSLVLPLDMSSVYGALRDLQEQGLIDGLRESAGARPPRTVFHLSAEARDLFDTWREEPVTRLREIRADFLLKLYFCRAAGPAAVVRLLDAQIAAGRAYRDRLAALITEDPPESFERLVRASKLSAAHATVAWLEQERARLTA